jgi:hypothetical protein
VSPFLAQRRDRRLGGRERHADRGGQLAQRVLPGLAGQQEQDLLLADGALQPVAGHRAGRDGDPDEARGAPVGVHNVTQ